ncbi:MAG: hypothetical protein Harvfovirus7_31 [Harvfovirus sp.]|uniref:Uncharacterized protein n=1 Tax=Harvfovirus sp. TaxID=2487768 RepID=A0A3G5A2V0_9VIRU|nr:MAG: hypothetical protein Harvfovirus7_31 [Harvfovirus sp.]
MISHKIDKYLKKLNKPNLTKDANDLYFYKLKQYLVQKGGDGRTDTTAITDTTATIPKPPAATPVATPAAPAAPATPKAPAAPTVSITIPTREKKPAEKWDELAERYRYNGDYIFFVWQQPCNGYKPSDFTLPFLLDYLPNITNVGLAPSYGEEKNKKANDGEQQLAVNVLTKYAYTGAGWKPSMTNDEMKKRYRVDKVIGGIIDIYRVPFRSALDLKSYTKQENVFTPAQKQHLRVIQLSELTLDAFIRKQTTRDARWKPVNKADEWFKVHGLTDITKTVPFVESRGSLYGQLDRYSKKLSHADQAKIALGIKQDKILLPIFYVFEIEK